MNRFLISLFLFSLTRNTSSRYQQFMERPMAAQALAPSRSLGINAKYQKNWLYTSGGIFFQQIDEGEKTAKIFPTKVYYLNFIMQIKYQDESDYKRFRITCTKKGIQEIEELKEFEVGEIG